MIYADTHLPQQRAVLKMWANAQDPVLTYKPIRQSALAAHFGATERHVNRILASARREDEGVFRELKCYRERRKGKPPRKNGKPPKRVGDKNG